MAPPSDAVAAVPGAGGGALEALGTWAGLKGGLREAVAKDPLDAALVTVFGGSFLFYLAEKDDNPKVTSYFDALVFISTCMSVGYADVFARTPAGKAIATAVMTVGPSLAAAVLNAPEEPTKPEAPPELLRVQGVIADKLDAILAELRASRAASG
jgi:hypothetical protein